MRLIITSLALFSFLLPTFAQPSTGGNAAKDKTFLATLPDVTAPQVDEARAVALAALPLSCVDHPQALPENRTQYIWLDSGAPHLLEGYDKNRMFYGCSDWHSAVHSLWALAAVAKQYPHTLINSLLRDRLKEHLDKKAVAGEMEFLKTSKRFEIPYGYAWVLKLYSELITWEDPDAKTWAANMAPLAQEVSKRLVQYFKDLPYAVRGGLHPNTANVSTLMLDYTEIVTDAPLRDAVIEADKKYFANDAHCNTAYEPSGTDFLSPCLTEARLMSRILDQPHYVAWLNDFLPAVSSPEFKPLTMAADFGEFKKEDLVGAKSHLVGLSFSRAEDFMAISNALPANDPRVPIFRRLAAINAKTGFDRLGVAGYEGAHWFATYALLYGRAAARATP
jgi:hypothetical protein